MDETQEKGIAARTKGFLAGEGTRINNVSGFLMLLTAGLFDLLNAFPIMNWFATFFFWMTFGLWLMIKGVGFVNPRRFAVWGVSAVIGFIPALSAAPELILAVGVTIAMVRAEDKLNIKLPHGTAPKKPVRGGRSQLAKNVRRATQTPEHNRETVRRLRRIQNIRSRKESMQKDIDGITLPKAA